MWEARLFGRASLTRNHALMRRNWLTVMLFVIALVAQTFAPTMNRVSAMPGLTSASEGFCLTDGRAVDVQKQAPGKAGHHRDFCPLCQFHCDGVAPLAARAGFDAATSRAVIAQPWRADARRLPVPDFDFARQARAPPAIS